MASLESNPVPFEVLGDDESTQRIGLELAVFAFDDPLLPLDVVPRRIDLKCLDELRGPGGGTFKIMRSDEKLIDTPELLDYRNVCKVYLDRKVVGGFLIQAKRTDYVNREERSGEFWEVAGGGLREWTRDAVVEPFGGIRIDSQSSRYFSFASERGDWYVEDDWAAPVLIQQHNLDPNEDPFGTAPAEWPDAPDAYWIWGVDNDAEDNPAPEGINYFRREFTIAPELGTKNYSVFVAAKDQFDVYVDGQPVIESRELNGYARTWRADFELGPGDHVVAARVRANGSGQAGLIAALFRAGDAATETPAELLSVSDATWLVNAYPDPAPGWTPGEIVLTLFAEAEARGVRFPTFLTPTFTTTTDSDGVPWARALDWSFDIGTEYYDVLERLEELVCDIWIDPETLELNLYAERGQHRDTQSPAAQPVTFRIGRNVTRASEEGTSSIKNALLLATEEGWQSVADGTTDSIAKYGRIEGYVSTGASASVSADLAQRIFSFRAQPETSSTYEIVDLEDARPHTDFFTGDWVLAPSADDENTLASRHLMSIAVSEDQDTGRPVFAIEFDTIYQERAARFERWLKTASNGTLGGTLANATGGGGGGNATSTAQNTQTGPQGLQGLQGPRGVNWQGEWDSGTSYLTYDAVQYDGSSWIAVAESLNKIPGTDPEWELLAEQGADGAPGAPGAPGEGLNWLGLWSSATAYVENDAVRYDGSSYVAIATSTNETPSSVSAFWDLIAEKGATGALVPRDVATLTTGSLANGAEVQTTVEMSYGYRLYRIETDKPARVRLYGNAAKQAADASRPVGTDPTGDHGLLFEFVTTVSVLSSYLSPLVDGANFESPPTVDTPITVTNLSGSSGTVTVDLTYAVTE